MNKLLYYTVLPVLLLVLSRPAPAQTLTISERGRFTWPDCPGSQLLGQRILRYHAPGLPEPGARLLVTVRTEIACPPADGGPQGPNRLVDTSIAFPDLDFRPAVSHWFFDSTPVASVGRDGVTDLLPAFHPRISGAFELHNVYGVTVSIDRHSQSRPGYEYLKVTNTIDALHIDNLNALGKEGWELADCPLDGQQTAGRIRVNDLGFEPWAHATAFYCLFTRKVPVSSGQ